MFLLLASFSLQAVEEVQLKHVEDEPRFNELSNVLRCMVCQNQTIADSNADLAKDFRNQVKEKINAGQSNEEIIDYMTARYGDYILYRPPFNAATALLWTGPFLLLVIGFFMILKVLRRRNQPDDVVPDPSQQDTLQQLLQATEDDSDHSGAEPLPSGRQESGHREPGKTP